MKTLFSPLVLILPLFISGLVWIGVPLLTRKIKSGFSWAALAILFFSGLNIFLNDRSIESHFSWQPLTGVMGVVFERSSLVLVLLAGLALMIVFRFLQKARQDQEISSTQIGLTFISLSVAIPALTTDHFLLRFAALEFSGLCVVATMLANNPTENSSWKKVMAIFLNFRVGDLALLAAILVMHVQSGTFLIDQSLIAAQSASLPVQLIASTGLMTAVWVKLSIWPLGWWAEAASHLPSCLRTWYVDLLLPILGAYLLYRAAPLLQVIHHLPDWIITLGILAAMVKILLSNLDHYQHVRSRLIQILSTVCLIAIAISSGQSILWAFMLYWLIARMIFSFCTIKHEHSPPRQTRKSVILNNASSFTLHAFSLLALIQISLSDQIHFIFSLFLWSFWWLLAIQDLRAVLVLKDLRQDKLDVRHKQPDIITSLLGALAALLFTSTLTIGVYWLINVVKGHGIWLFSYPDKINQQFGIFNLLAVNGLAIVLAWLFLKGALPRVDSIKMTLTSFTKSLHIRSLRIPARVGKSSLDPLDQSSRFFSLVQKAATSIYQTLEQNSVDRITYWLQKIFTFLFEKIEKFTSVELWQNILQKTIDASLGMQRWHSGLLRLNLFWFLLFILILMIILHYQNPIFLLPTG